MSAASTIISRGCADTRACEHRAGVGLVGVFNVFRAWEPLALCCEALLAPWRDETAALFPFAPFGVRTAARERAPPDVLRTAHDTSHRVIARRNCLSPLPPRSSRGRGNLRLSPMLPPWLQPCHPRRRRTPPATVVTGGLLSPVSSARRCNLATCIRSSSSRPTRLHLPWRPMTALDRAPRQPSHRWCWLAISSSADVRPSFTGSATTPVF